MYGRMYSMRYPTVHTIQPACRKDGLNPSVIHIMLRRDRISDVVGGRMSNVNLMKRISTTVYFFSIDTYLGTPGLFGYSDQIRSLPAKGYAT